MTMNLIDQAIEFAAVAHDGQYRKGTKVPYIMHPLAVGFLLQRLGCEDEVIIAGMLHDTVEDTDVNLEIIQRQFGKEVTRLVQGVSEENKEWSWEKRKQHTITKLKQADEAITLITLADKIHNLRTVEQELSIRGDEVWNKFNRGKDQQQWYHTSIYEATKHHDKNPMIAQLRGEYEECIKHTFK